MRDLLRIVVAALVSFFVGLPLGYLMGVSGKGDLEAKLARESKRAGAAEKSLQQRQQAGSERERETERVRALLLAKSELLKAQLELHRANFGMASQHLGMAGKQLKQARELLGKKQKKRVDNLIQRISDTVLVAGRLDTNARAFVEEMVGELELLPGAR